MKHFSPLEVEAEAFRRRARAQRPVRPALVLVTDPGSAVDTDMDPERRSAANANELLRLKTVKLVVLAFAFDSVS